MAEAVGIRFRPCGKMYCFQAGGVSVKPGSLVVVESELGLSIGRVVLEKCESPEEKELKKIVRLASEEDLKEQRSNKELEDAAFSFCRERITARGLQMKLIRTESTLDRKRIIFYFVSEKRIDFRELVKDLAQKFHTRIEMRQVGVRDEAKMTGGLGVCGRTLCCVSFLNEFAPISIKMAKKQELVLNTGKLSGICGRLMCCLSYEYKDHERRGHEASPPEEAPPIEEITVPEELLIVTETAAGPEQPKPSPAPSTLAPSETKAPAGGPEVAAETASQTANPDHHRRRKKRRRWRKKGRQGPS